MRAVKGAIFDLDGTLVDSMPVWDRVADDYLRSLGIKTEGNTGEILKTCGLRQAARYFIKNYGLRLTEEEIADGVNGLLKDFYGNAVNLKRGAAEYLEKLRRAGVRACVATATDLPLAEAALKRCGVADMFCGIITEAQAGAGKRNPRIYEEALKIIGAPKSQTVVFEDALHAASTAKAAGFTVAAVYDASEKNQAAMKKISDYYIKDFSLAEIF